jgi:chromosome segregation ATPase
MKNFSFYLFLPLILLVAFLFTPSVGYFAAQKKIEAREIAQAEELARVKAAEDEKRAEIEKRAEEDARARQEESAKAELAKEEKKRKDYEDAIAKLEEDIKTFSGEADAFAAEIANLEIQLVKLRDRKEAEDRETLELAKQVELAKIDRRIAEMEIQRMVAMVREDLNSSPLICSDRGAAESRVARQHRDRQSGVPAFGAPVAITFSISRVRSSPRTGFAR